jgi:hypothetical protein
MEGETGERGAEPNESEDRVRVIHVQVVTLQQHLAFAKKIIGKLLRNWC